MYLGFAALACSVAGDTRVEVSLSGAGGLSGPNTGRPAADLAALSSSNRSLSLSACKPAGLVYLEYGPMPCFLSTRSLCSA